MRHIVTIAAALALAACQTNAPTAQPITRTTTTPGGVSQVERYSHLTDAEAWSEQKQSCYNSLAARAEVEVGRQRDLMALRSSLISGMTSDSMRLAGLAMIQSQNTTDMMGRAFMAFASQGQPAECASMGPFEYKQARAQIWGNIAKGAFGMVPWIAGVKAIGKFTGALSNASGVSIQNNGDGNSIDYMGTAGDQSPFNYSTQTAPYGGIPLTSGDPGSIIANPNAIPEDPNAIPEDPNVTPTTTTP